MARRTLTLRLFAATALTLALAACKDDQSARIDAPEPVPLAELAVIDDLPAAPPAPIGDYGPSRGYPLAERAYGLQQALYDVPPDYGFAYDDEDEYVWETADDWTMYAEPWDDGYRYYYYEPGEAYPYFVRDRNYGYGYDDGGVLVAVFDAGGRYLSRDLAYRMAPTAGRYYARGHELWQARSSAPRVQITERTWAAQAPRLVRTAEPWLRAGREQADWRQWRARNDERELRRFEPEQRQRQASAEVWRARLAADRVQPQAAIREDRRAAQADRTQLHHELQRQMQFERREAQLQARAEHQQAQAERQAAIQQRHAEDQARARDDDRRRQAFEQGRRQQAEQRAHAEQAQRQQAEQAERRQQQFAAREQARAQHEQQAQARIQAERVQAERAQHEQQAQAERQARQQAQRAEHEAQQQAQQQARQQQAQQAREQARAADHNGRGAAAHEGGKPDHPGKGRKD